MKNEISIDQHQLQRLTNSLMVLRPRMDAITSEFCTLVEVADPTLRLMFPSDERTIAPVLEQLLTSVTSVDESATLMFTMGQMGTSMGINEYHLPTLLAAIQTAIAQAAGYTWTEKLEHDWTMWFDALTGWAIQGARSDESIAA